MLFSVTATGLVTSLGYGAAGTCAALRAGVSVPREVAGSPGDDDLDAPGISVAGFPAHVFAEGFFQTGAWVRLASGALDDARARFELPAGAGTEFWTRTGLLGAVPLVARKRFLWTLDVAPDAPRTAFLEPLAALTPGLSAAKARWNAAGHVSLAAALEQVAQGLAAREADRFVVAAADSFVDEWSLTALAEAGRLKDPDHPTGLMPGEAGAALLLETEQAARLRRAEVLGHVEAVAVGGPIPPEPPPESDKGADIDDEGDDAPAWLPPPAPKLGRAIADTVRKVLPPPAAGARWRGDLYLDLNGEYWRSEAWGHACVHLAREVDLDACRVLVPAACLGETGAASAPIAVAWALWSFDRDRTEQAIVVSAADDGATGAIRLSAPRLAHGPG